MLHQGVQKWSITFVIALIQMRIQISRMFTIKAFEDNYNNIHLIKSGIARTKMIFRCKYLIQLLLGNIRGQLKSLLSKSS